MPSLACLTLEPGEAPTEQPAVEIALKLAAHERRQRRCAQEQSRRPPSTPLATGEDLVVAIVESREAHPTWGPRKLRHVLSRRFGEQRSRKPRSFQGLSLGQDIISTPNKSLFNSPPDYGSLGHRVWFAWALGWLGLGLGAAGIVSTSRSTFGWFEGGSRVKWGSETSVLLSEVPVGLLPPWQRVPICSAGRRHVILVELAGNIQRRDELMGHLVAFRFHSFVSTICLVAVAGCGGGKSNGNGAVGGATAGATSLAGSTSTGATASNGGVTSALVCTPGATQACLGPGQCAGAQVCNNSGSAWQTCDCGTGIGGASSTGGNSSTSANGGAANAGGTTSAGGTMNTGGAVNTGGTMSAGGTASAGGTSAGSGGATAGTGGAVAGPPITGLTIWLDASEGVTRSGTVVIGWADQSVSGENATGVVQNGPTIIANAVNGYTALHFSNSATLLNVAGSGTAWASNSFLLELVVRATIAGDTIWGQQDITGNGLGLWSSYSLSANGPNLMGQITVSTTADYSDDSLHSFGVWRDGDNFSLLLDGAVVGTNSLPNFDATGGAATIGTFDGDLFEVIGRNSAVTTADVAAVESYFHAKYGTP